MNDDRSDLAEGHAQQGEGDAGWAAPIFRTVTTPSGRHALRLETVFWQAIERMAASTNRKSSDLVRELVGLSEEQETNLSSAMRSIIVHRLLDEQERLSPLTAPMAMVKLLQTAPTPSFALDRHKRLVRVNDEFMRYLRTVLARSGPVEKAQLRLERPAETIFAELGAGEVIECGVSIQVDNHERRTQARIVLPPPAPSDVLVGFILG